jgi:ketosteroid isomerase-like protein
MTDEQAAPSPAEVYAEFVSALIARDHYLDFVDDFYAADATHELPFAPPGVPTVTAGKEEIRALMAAGSDMSPLRYDAVREAVARLADDGETLIVEHTVAGHIEPSGKTFEHPGVLFLTVKAGKITRFREYSNPLGLAEVLGGTPSFDLTLDRPSA